MAAADKGRATGVDAQPREGLGHLETWAERVHERAHEIGLLYT